MVETLSSLTLLELGAFCFFGGIFSGDEWG